jgi:hypothetical protein
VRNVVGSYLCLGAMLRSLAWHSHPIIQIWSLLSLLGLIVSTVYGKPFCKPLYKGIVGSEIMWIIAVANVPGANDAIANSIEIQCIILMGFVGNCLVVVARKR